MSATKFTPQDIAANLDAEYCIQHRAGGHDATPEQVAEFLERHVLRKKSSLAESALTWSSEKPTKPGWYWYRSDPSKEPFVTEAVLHEGELFESGEILYPFTSGQYAGPIAPPAEGK